VSNDLSGKVALVTGANRGIGLATAKSLLRAGAEVWLGCRCPDEANRIALDFFESYGSKGRPLAMDVADPKSIKAAFSAIHSSGTGLDILVNNAGILQAAVFEMTSVEMIDALHVTNLRGLLLCTQYAVRLMSRRGGGSIINLSSIMGRVGYPGQSAYAASKAAVIGATQSLAKELASKGIRVNAVAPGAIDTAMTADLSPILRAQTVRAIAMGRLGRPEEVASVCVFLSGDSSTYVTGQVIGVDGGMVV
jgi:3-oxoacyl-[acyl-carrier protein] reductase